MSSPWIIFLCIIFPTRAFVTRPATRAPATRSLPESGEAANLFSTSTDVEYQLWEAQKALVALDDENQELRRTIETYKRQMAQYQGQLKDAVVKRQEMKGLLEATQAYSERIKDSNTKH